jgi:hypothetical protein
VRRRGTGLSACPRADVPMRRGGADSRRDHEMRHAPVSGHLCGRAAWAWRLRPALVVSRPHSPRRSTEWRYACLLATSRMT